MLLEGIGKGVEVHEIDEARMIQAMALLRRTAEAGTPEETNGVVREHLSAVTATAD
jgi:hypothetical protein